MSNRSAPAFATKRDVSVGIPSCGNNLAREEDGSQAAMRLVGQRDKAFVIIRVSAVSLPCEAPFPSRGLGCVAASESDFCGSGTEK